MRARGETELKRRLGEVSRSGPRMKPRVTVITLCVDDLERAVRFYRDGLGFETQGIIGKEFEHGAVALFDLQRGLKLALWPRESLAHDAGLPEGRPSATEFTLGHNVSSEAEVDAVMLDIEIEFLEAAFVEKDFEPLARGQLALGVLSVDALLPAAHLGCCAALLHFGDICGHSASLIRGGF